MSALDLAALRGLCERATEGPWRIYNTIGCQDVIITEGDRRKVVLRIDDDDDPRRDDLAFICEARTALPAAVAEIERLRAVVEEAREAVMEIDCKRTISDVSPDGYSITISRCGTCPPCLARLALDACPGSPLLDGGR